jgi:hypothetical protein
MLNWKNNAGNFRLFLAVFALLTVGLVMSQNLGSAQKKAPPSAPPPAGDTKGGTTTGDSDDVAAPTTPGDADRTGSSSGKGGAAGSGNNGKNAPQVIQDDGFITVTGSTGQLDETGFALADYRNFEIGFRNTPTPASGTFIARYNITAVKDAFRTAPGATNNYQLRIRYRDTDGMGTSTRVQLGFFRASVLDGSGGGQLIAAFDSNLFTAPATQIFQTRTATICPRVVDKLDFGNFVYWVEATLTRTGNLSHLANFGSLQFTETEMPCTPAP